MMMLLVPDAIEAFAAEMGTLGLARKTVECQVGYLRRFGKACEQAAADRSKRMPLKVTEIDSAVITAYFATCTGSQGTRNNMLIPLRKFFTWLEAQHALAYGTGDRLLATRKHRKHTRRPKHYIPVEQFAPALDISGERHPEDRAVMALALYTLARRSELAGIRLGDVWLTEQLIKVYREKRKRWTDVAICPELNAELDSWLRVYAQTMGYVSYAVMMSDHPGWKLAPRLIFGWAHGECGRYEGAATEWTLDPENSPTHLERVVKRALDVLGAQTVDGRQVRHLGEGMHTIRRSGARAMLDHLSHTLGQDRALLQVATMLDHEDPKQTLLYIGLDQEREQLNTWLKSNSMYGTGVSDELLRTGHGQVRSLRSVSSDVRQRRAV